MTMKTAKNNSTILSRIGVGAFLIAALTATVPISFAGDPEAPQTKSITKKTMKWVENNDGVETSKQYEITIEDGVTTAYSIDEHGNKTLVDASEVEMMGGPDGQDGAEAMSVFVMNDGEASDEKIKIMMGEHMQGMDNMNGDHVMKMMGEDGQSKIIIKRMSKGEDGSMSLNMNSDVFIMDGEGGQASAMVSAAQSLLDQTDDKDLSSKARRKLDKARKALKEAQAAIEAEE